MFFIEPDMVMRFLYVPDNIPCSLHVSSVACCFQLYVAQQFLCVVDPVSFCTMCCTLTDKTATVVLAQGSSLCDIKKHIMVAERFGS